MENQHGISSTIQPLVFLVAVGAAFAGYATDSLELVGAGLVIGLVNFAWYLGMNQNQGSNGALDKVSSVSSEDPAPIVKLRHPSGPARVEPEVLRIREHLREAHSAPKREDPAVQVAWNQRTDDEMVPVVVTFRLDHSIYYLAVKHPKEFREKPLQYVNVATSFTPGGHSRKKHASSSPPYRVRILTESEKSLLPEHMLAAQA